MSPEFKRGDQFVVCSAVKMRNNKTHETALLIGPRHWDPTMHEQRKRLLGLFWEEDSSAGLMTSQGFIDQRGNYLTREEACKIARRNGQIVETGPGYEAEDRLFSENLY